MNARKREKKNKNKPTHTPLLLFTAEKDIKISKKQKSQKWKKEN